MMPYFFCGKKLFLVCVTGLLAFSVVSCVLGPSNPGMYLGSKRDDCGLAVGPTIGKSLRWNRDNPEFDTFIGV